MAQEQIEPEIKGMNLTEPLLVYKTEILISIHIYKVIKNSYV